VPIDPVEALTRVAVFADLDRKDLARLAKDFTERTFPAGSVVVKQGDERGIGFFVISAGEATVEVDGGAVGTMGPGDHFGEIALLGDRSRTATVTAKTDLETLVMTVWEFRAFVQSDAEIAWKLLQRVAGLLAEAQRRH
jgi:CRP-like cAMP-binding protein